DSIAAGENSIVAGAVVDRQFAAHRTRYGASDVVGVHSREQFAGFKVQMVFGPQCDVTVDDGAGRFQRCLVVATPASPSAGRGDAGVATTNSFNPQPTWA